MVKKRRLGLAVKQKGRIMCDNPARYRFTWPGQDEALICEDHVDRLFSIAAGIGLRLQIIPLSEKDLEMGLICDQKSE